MNRVLVTGGAGFIGSHTCLVLIEKGFDLVVLDSYVNSSKKSLERVIEIVACNNPNYSSRLKIIQGDLRDFS